MPPLHLTVLTTRNETWRLRKRTSKFKNLNFMSAILSRFSILFINYYIVCLCKYFIQAFCSVPGCQICMCKRGISYQTGYCMQNITTRIVSFNFLSWAWIPPAGGPQILSEQLSHKHLPIVVPIHCELQLSSTSCSKWPFFDFRIISPYSFFNALGSFQLTLYW